MKSLEKLMLAVTAETKEARNQHEQQFNELSDKLQSIETSISKLSKSNEDPPKSDDDSMRKAIDESTVQTNNQANVASEKRFKLNHVFKNVKKFKENVKHYSEKEVHYNAKWSICVKRLGNQLIFYTYCEPIDPSTKWSFLREYEHEDVDKTQNDAINPDTFCFQKKCGTGNDEFVKWEEMGTWCLVDGNLTVETNLTIIETTGLGKKKIRKFDESQKDVSDVILVVGITKFYVSKMFLASQSSVFKALLFGNFKESKQSVVTLNGIDPNDFHYFLEILYGESAIDEFNVEDIARLADMYDAPTAVRKCEEFLLKDSKKTVEMKLTIASRYHLENLEEKCMSEITAKLSKNADCRTQFDFRGMLFCVSIFLFIIWSLWMFQ
ncbi:hypothetical protein B9Z55_007709 [Caenorhabditis nigoni]|nr:hypothetical protein B9Z55_007709 [Caenorhabditis nigoni]